MAIWEKIYSLIGWENQPSTKTPISASNLNKMDVAINELDDRVLELGGSVENILGEFESINGELTTLNNKSIQNMVDVGSNNIVDFVDSLPNDKDYSAFFSLGGSYDVVGTPHTNYTWTTGYFTRSHKGTSRIVVFHRAGYPFIVKSRYGTGEWTDWYYPNITWDAIV